MQPLVSVIVPVYNQQEFLVKTLDSIVHGSYSNIEIIIIDDFSTDDSVESIEKWIKSSKIPYRKVVFIKNSQNLGVCKSLNFGILASRGEFITVIAADDIMLWDGIKSRVEYLRLNNDKLAVIGNCNIIDKNDKVTALNGIENRFSRRNMNTKLMLNTLNLYYEIVIKFSLPGPIFLCRRELYKRVGLYDEDVLAEDLDMYLRVSQIGLLGYLDSIVSQYRIHESNTSMGKNSKKIRKSVKITYQKHANKSLLSFFKYYGNIIGINSEFENNKLKSVAMKILSKIFQVIAEILYIYNKNIKI